MIYQIEAVNKKGHPDQHGKHILQDIRESGIKGVNKVAYSQVYQIEGHLNLREVDLIARELLIDSVTQTYSLCNPMNPRHSGVTGGHEIEIWYRHGVTDTVAESVIKAVQDLGMSRHIKVRTGQKYLFETSLSKGAIEQVVKRLIVNTLIQEYKKIK
ncbi:MAG: phosphoribosylformylglycinamidine synthase subunit PurS [Elusimicrobiota bacterium]